MACRISDLPLTSKIMSRDTARIRKDVAAHRQRQLAAGRALLNIYVPSELVAAIDRIKEQRGASARAPIIEEALRFYIEKHERA